MLPRSLTLSNTRTLPPHGWHETGTKVLRVLFKANEYRRTRHKNLLKVRQFSLDDQWSQRQAGTMVRYSRAAAERRSTSRHASSRLQDLPASTSTRADHSRGPRERTAPTPPHQLGCRNYLHGKERSPGVIRTNSRSRVL